MKEENLKASLRSREEIEEDLVKVRKEVKDYGIRLHEAMEEGMPDEFPESFQKITQEAFSVRAELERLEIEMEDWKRAYNIE